MLEPVFAYLMIAKAQYEDKTKASWYNVGPDDCDCRTTGEIVDLFCEKWGGIKRLDRSEKDAPHEAGFLKLDSSKLKRAFGWKPRWHIEEAVDRVCEWSRVWFEGGDIPGIMDKQINDYING